MKLFKIRLSLPISRFHPRFHPRFGGVTEAAEGVHGKESGPHTGSCRRHENSSGPGSYHARAPQTWICFLLIEKRKGAISSQPNRVAIVPSLGAVQTLFAGLQSRSSCRGLHIPPAKALPCVPVGSISCSAGAPRRTLIPHIKHTHLPPTYTSTQHCHTHSHRSSVSFTRYFVFVFFLCFFRYSVSISVFFFSHFNNRATTILLSDHARLFPDLRSRSISTRWCRTAILNRS